MTFNNERKKTKILSEKFQAALLKNTLVFKQYQLNLLEEKEKVLNQSISFINQLKSQKLVRFAILQKTFQIIFKFL